MSRAVSRAATRAARIAAVAALQLLAGGGGPARAQTAVPAAEPVRVVLVGATAETAELERNARGLLGDPPAVDIARDTVFRPQDMFRLDGEGAGRAAGWVVVTGPVAWVRAAAPRRDRFVFRHLTVAAPLTELDRERIGQTLKAALATVIEGGPGALDRGDAEALAGVAAAVPVAPATPPAAATPPATATPPVIATGAPAAAPVPLPAAAPPAAAEPRFGLGLVYEVEYSGAALLHGPGLIASLRLGSSGLHGDVWLLVRYDIADEVDDGLTDLDVHGQSVRVGGGVALFPRLRLGVALGADMVRASIAKIPLNAFPSSFNWFYPLVGRFYLRAGPVAVGRLALSAVALVEAANRPIRQEVILGGDIITSSALVGQTRFGLALELRWQ
jgi:hypothetical protein